jgi:hypothetical protein
LKKNAKAMEVSSMTNRPIQKFRIGTIEAAVWENTKKTDNGEVSYKTISLSRSFRKKDENIWRSEIINNIRRNDIAKLQAILHKLQHFLYFETGEKHDEEGDE